MMGSLVTDRTPRRPYKVMTLWDAIEEIKDRVKENTEFSIRNGELY
jgi:hypothetical protein